MDRSPRFVIPAQAETPIFAGHRKAPEQRQYIAMSRPINSIALRRNLLGDMSLRTCSALGRLAKG